MEIESRLLPCGLHVVGRPPTAIEAIATLVNIAEVDRPSNNPPVLGLPGTMARSIGRNIEQIYLSSNKVGARTRQLACSERSKLALLHTPCCRADLPQQQQGGAPHSSLPALRALTRVYWHGGQKARFMRIHYQAVGHPLQPPRLKHSHGLCPSDKQW